MPGVQKPKTYKFHQCLAFSEGVSVQRNVKDILLQNIPGATDAWPAEGQDNRNGTDWWVRHERGEDLSVDLKARVIDWAVLHPDQDDLALETWSVVEWQVPGWTRCSKKRTDYILWLWQDTGRWSLVPFLLLCAVFNDKWQEWIKRYKVRPQFTPSKTGGYHSECVFVPRRVVWAELWRRYSGQPQERS